MRDIRLQVEQTFLVTPDVWEHPESIEDDSKYVASPTHLMNLEAC